MAKMFESSHQIHNRAMPLGLQIPQNQQWFKKTILPQKVLRTTTLNNKRFELRAKRRCLIIVEENINRSIKLDLVTTMAISLFIYNHLEIPF